jgi:chemotaxis protein methyltransferase CheR
MTSEQAVNLGLIVAELVLEALKRAPLPGRIVVAFETAATDWKLSVCDGGIGNGTDLHAQEASGLDASIVRALAQQLEAEVDIKTGSTGTTVSIAHAARSAAHVAGARRSRKDRAVPEPKRALEVPGKSRTGIGKFAA